jgi:hypothetical protein
VTSPTCTGFQSLPDQRAQLVERDRLRQVRIESSARLAQHGRGSTALCQYLCRLRTPQQLGKRLSVYRGIEFSLPHRLKADSTARPACSDVDSPPAGNMQKSFLEMAVANYKSRSIQNGIVDFDLPRQPVESVGVTLDLEAMKKTIHDGDVYATRSMTKAELIEHERIGIAVMIL